MKKLEIQSNLNMVKSLIQSNNKNKQNQNLSENQNYKDQK